MNIEQIRTKLTNEGAYNLNEKEQFAYWLAYGCDVDFSYGLTLMPKKVFYKKVPKSRYAPEGDIFRHITQDELEKAIKKFLHILNYAIYKQAYKRYGKKLDVVMTIEGSGTVDLHSHLALSKPSHLTIKEFSKVVNESLKVSSDFEINNPNYDEEKDGLDEKYRYKLDTVDGDWMFYITKKLDKKSLSNLYLL